jgi:glycerol-3-phosphate acyltransferase PlsY
MYETIIFVLCYLIGSVPFAYVLVKLKSNKDITKEGSGNVGTLNSLMVTGSKAVGAIVLVLDVLKGLIPVYILLYVTGTDYFAVMIGSCGIILGHNYPVWLKFKGGRGLAPGAGIFLILNYYIIIGWLLMWLLVFLFRKKVLIANTVATFALPVYIVLINLFPVLVVNEDVSGFSLSYFTIFSIVITIVILSRHTEVYKPKK